MIISKVNDCLLPSILHPTKNNNKYEEEMIYLKNIDLLNINKIILEMIHLAENHCCIYVDTPFFTILSEMQF